VPGSRSPTAGRVGWEEWRRFRKISMHRAQRVSTSECINGVMVNGLMGLIYIYINLYILYIYVCMYV
jgi:hypothetical protein